MKTKIREVGPNKYVVLLEDHILARFNTFNDAYEYYVNTTIDPSPKQLMWMGLRIRSNTGDWGKDYKEKFEARKKRELEELTSKMTEDQNLREDEL